MDRVFFLYMVLGNFFFLIASRYKYGTVGHVHLYTLYGIMWIRSFGRRGGVGSVNGEDDRGRTRVYCMPSSSLHKIITGQFDAHSNIRCILKCTMSVPIWIADRSHLFIFATIH